jgi:hypothetical protein
VSDGIRQLSGDEGEEVWERLSDDPPRLRIDCVGSPAEGWSVTVWVLEHLWEYPLGEEMGRRIESSLRAVDGVTGVYENSRVRWDVLGSAASGRALTRAAAQVVDDLADEVRLVVDDSGNIRT